MSNDAIILHRSEVGAEPTHSTDRRAEVQRNAGAPRQLGLFAGKFEISDEFYDPLPDDVLDSFYTPLPKL